MFSIYLHDRKHYLKDSFFHSKVWREAENISLGDHCKEAFLLETRKTLSATICINIESWTSGFLIEICFDNT